MNCRIKKTIFYAYHIVVIYSISSGQTILLYSFLISTEASFQTVLLKTEYFNDSESVIYQLNQDQARASDISRVLGWPISRVNRWISETMAFYSNQIRRIICLDNVGLIHWAISIFDYQELSARCPLRWLFPHRSYFTNPASMKYFSAPI